jgi:hypothetical protein
MATRGNPQQPTNRTLRLIGWCLAGALALGGNLVGPSPAALWLELAGAAIFAVGTVRPSGLRPIYNALAYLARPFTYMAGYQSKTNPEPRPRPTRSRRGRIANSEA